MGQKKIDPIHCNKSKCITVLAPYMKNKHRSEAAKMAPKCATSRRPALSGFFRSGLLLHRSSLQHSYLQAVTFAAFLALSQPAFPAVSQTLAIPHIMTLPNILRDSALTS